MIVENLRVEGKRLVISGINLTLERGVVVVGGGSGSGKTLLMLSIAGLNEFFGIKVEGNVIADCSVLFEETDNQLIGYTVEDEIEIAGIDKKILERLGMKGYEKRELHTLSGGELKKICIAEALSKDAKDLILDDPQSHVDPEAFEELCRIIKELSRERAVLILTRRPDLFDFGEHYVLTERGLIKRERPYEVGKTSVKRGDGVVVRGRNVSFSYGNHPVFRNLNFEFGEGVSVITGRNGSGKTTLLKIISGLLKCEGVVERSGKVSYVHQFPDRAFFHTYAWEEARRSLGDGYSEVLEMFGIDGEKRIEEMNRRENAARDSVLDVR